MDYRKVYLYSTDITLCQNSDKVFILFLVGVLTSLKKINFFWKYFMRKVKRYQKQVTIIRIKFLLMKGHLNKGREESDCLIYKWHKYFPFLAPRWSQQRILPYPQSNPANRCAHYSHRLWAF